MFKTTTRIMSLGSGENLAAGSFVTPEAFTPERWAALIAEGAIAEIVTDDAPQVEGDWQAFDGMEEIEPQHILDITAGALELAQEHDFDLIPFDGQGTGKNGRIIKSDVQGWLNATTN